MTDKEVGVILSETARVLKDDGLLILVESIPTTYTHMVDIGGYIRNEEENSASLNRIFKVVKKERFRSGICDYVLFVCKKRTE